jgi:hypothetical protein
MVVMTLSGLISASSLIFAAVRFAATAGDIVCGGVLLRIAPRQARVLGHADESANRHSSSDPASRRDRGDAHGELADFQALHKQGPPQSR